MTKVFTIKKGHHYSGLLHFGITFKKHILFKAMLEESCLYDLHSNDNYDINKLFGFSTTYYHHNQSARIGWRCINQKDFEIVTYTYNSGERFKETVLGVVKPNEWFTCIIEDIETDYIYTFIKDGETKVARTPKQEDKVLFKYLLYPYFGGNESAPHNMKIHINRLKKLVLDGRTYQ